MANKSYFAISGVPIKTPDKFKMERYMITNMTRTADGKMKGDIIAKKFKFYLTWEVLGKEHLDEIVNLIWNGPLFFDFTFTRNGERKTVKAYSGMLPEDLYKVKNGTWLWQNFEIHIIEQ